MKKSVIMLLMATVTGILYAQDPAVKDKVEEAVVTKVIVNDGKNVESTVVKEEVTTKENKVRISDQEGETINQNIEYIPSEGKTTVKVNPLASLIKTTHYLNKNKHYTFTPDKNGFYISLYDPLNKKQKRTAKSAKTSLNDYFIITGEGGRNGIGYFDNYGNFIIEYYDKPSDKTLVERYAPTN
jgi:hypothetical protein